MKIQTDLKYSTVRNCALAEKSFGGMCNPRTNKQPQQLHRATMVGQAILLDYSGCQSINQSIIYPENGTEYRYAHKQAINSYDL